MARKSGFVRRNNRMVRETSWAGIPVGRQSIGSGTAVLLTSLDAAGLALRPFTVIRTRGIIGLKSDQVIAGEPQQLAYGHCVVSDQALAIGVTAVPTPVTDVDSDLWFTYEMLMAEFAFITGAGFDAQGMISRVFDSKAMRKVEEGQQLISVMETPSSATAEGVTVTDHFRCLIKLH